MNVDFEDEYGRRLRAKMRRKHLSAGCFVPVFVAGSIIAVLTLLNTWI